MSIDLDSLTLAELVTLGKDVARAIEEKKKTELVELRQKIEDLIKESPFTRDEVLTGKGAKKTVAPKYKNPNDSNQTWTGRGRKPKWVVEHLEQGGDLGSLEI